MTRRTYSCLAIARRHPRLFNSLMRRQCAGPIQGQPRQPA
jgi:hypothetical protein